MTIGGLIPRQLLNASHGFGEEGNPSGWVRVILQNNLLNDFTECGGGFCRALLLQPADQLWQGREMSWLLKEVAFAVRCCRRSALPDCLSACCSECLHADLFVIIFVCFLPIKIIVSLSTTFI